jgi:hypothetical protein
MGRRLAWLLCAAVVFCPVLRAQPAQQAKTQVSPMVVFWEDGFPAADTASVSRAALEAALPQARFTAMSELPAALARPETRLLVLPYGSAFPEQDWGAIADYLRRGGNLLVLGGKAFTRPANRQGGTWKLQSERMAYAQRLLVNRYEETPGSSGLTFERSEDFSFLHLPSFGWSRSFSLVARLSSEDLYAREGSAGGIDAHFSTLVWGAAGDQRLSAPLVEIDHFKKDFLGGRWIFLACDPDPGFLDSAAGRELTGTLAARAAQGAELFLVQPEWPLFLEGEPWVIRMRWDRFEAAPEPVRLEIEIRGSDATERRSFEIQPHEYPYTTEFTLPPHAGSGLRVVTARLEAGGHVRAIFRTGFWLRDTAYLDSGPRVSINHDFFEIDGHPAPVVGSTYMAGDVQREFFMSPNPYVWDQDMGQMRRAGINMLRTGWWTAWDQVMKESGVVHEEMLRALEAFLMTARRHDLPVQFNFFAFIPDALGGGNPYLNPDAVRRQKQLVLTVVRQFRDVPYLMWDLINEPSFSNPRELWMTRPGGGPSEVAAWNRWLAKRYPSREALAAAWDSPLLPEGQPVPLPRDLQFSPAAALATGRFFNSIEVHDYYLFSQEEFRDWAEQMHQAIRAMGSRQLVTVGQDEGGGIDRPSPSWYASSIDFTTTHTWWLNDALLWDSLVAKVPDEPMLVQETGIQRALGIDGSPRRSQEQAAALLNRKLTMALATGAGAIQWLWNTNAYMNDDNEVAIGALRVDGTEKPQELVLSRLAQFARASAGYFEHPEEPPVAIVTSQAFQYSALNALAIEAQQKAVRALEYSCRVESRVVPENRIGQLGHPRLTVLPSPMALGDAAWKGLLEYVKAGGNLLITGSMERDEEWHVTNRLAAFDLDARPVPLLFHQAQITLGSRTVPISFGAQSQVVLDVLRTKDGKPFHEIRLGQGRLFVIDYPVELAEGAAAAASVYQWALEQVGVHPRFSGQVSAVGVLIRPEIFSRAVLYLFDSESDSEQPIDVRDNATGAEIKFVLPARASRLILLGKPDGRVIARYGF